MAFPLDLADISLIFAFVSIVLLITSEMLSPYFGTANLKINRKRLRNSALATSLIFLTTIALRIVSIILNT